MSNINNVIVSGRLTRDPELKHLPSGTAVAEIGLAVNHSRKNDAGEWEDEPNFFDVSVYGGRGEVLAAKGKKGDSVTVAGRLQQRTWEDQETGKKREKVSIVAQNVEGELFFRSREEAEAAAPAPAAADDDIPF